MIQYTLQGYVDTFHNGSKADFARAFDRRPQGVTKMFARASEWLVLVSETHHQIVQIRASQLQ